jgi:hypothetical protein
MYYLIQKSLGAISAVVTETIPQIGLCVEFKNYQLGTDTAIIIYQNGKPSDVTINGWTFPCVYNKIKKIVQSDIYGGNSIYTIDFECLDPNGKIQKIENKSIYGAKGSLDVEYFYSLLYNVSCCENIEQANSLYKNIIDNDNIHFQYSSIDKRKDAIQVLNFIESFTPQLSKIVDTEFIVGLERKIKEKFEVAQNIIASASTPV